MYLVILNPKKFPPAAGYFHTWLALQNAARRIFYLKIFKKNVWIFFEDFQKKSANFLFGIFKKNVSIFFEDFQKNLQKKLSKKMIPNTSKVSSLSEG